MGLRRAMSDDENVHYFTLSRIIFCLVLGVVLGVVFSFSYATEGENNNVLQNIID